MPISLPHLENSITQIATSMDVYPYRALLESDGYLAPLEANLKT